VIDMTLPTVEEISKLTTPELVKKIKRRIDECGINLSEEPETIEIRDGDTFLNQAVKGLIIDMGKQKISELDLFRIGIDIKCYREMKADLDAALNMTISKYNVWKNFLNITRSDLSVKYDGSIIDLNNFSSVGFWEEYDYTNEHMIPNVEDPLGYFARLLFKMYPYDPSMTDTKNIKRYAINNFISALRNEESPMTSYIFEKLMEIHNMDFRIGMMSCLYDPDQPVGLPVAEPKYRLVSTWESRPNIFK
jgi:hypothetical protein